jgi:hypothetical protein
LQHGHFVFFPALPVKAVHDEMLADGDDKNAPVYYTRRHIKGKGMEINDNVYKQGYYVTVTTRNPQLSPVDAHARIESIIQTLGNWNGNRPHDNPHWYDIEVGNGDKGPVARVGFHDLNTLKDFHEKIKATEMGAFWRKPQQVDVDQFSSPGPNIPLPSLTHVHTITPCTAVDLARVLLNCIDKPLPDIPEIAVYLILWIDNCSGRTEVRVWAYNSDLYSGDVRQPFPLITHLE